jgi:hypothetical protein
VVDSVEVVEFKPAPAKQLKKSSVDKFSLKKVTPKPAEQKASVNKD